MKKINPLKYIFEPESVAVIGASSKAGTVGYAIFSNILQSDFRRAVYPINPKHDNIMSVKAYKDITSVSDEIDLAIICVPVKAVKNIVKQCVKKKVKGVVVITAGFKEVGKKGAEIEEEISSLAKKHNIILIGPNCLGIINTQKEVSLNANFAVNMPHPGNIALISQSGAIGVAALEYAHQHNQGISKFASIGNKAVIDESDVLEYLIDDKATQIITIYAEDISHPSRFFKMANRANSKQKPIIVIKTGRSVRGAIATHSHTGALSSSDNAYDSLFAQCGVIRVETLAELFEYAKGFTCLVKPKGDKITIVTNAGGMGVIATDAVERTGLEMSSLKSKTTKSLKKILPATANINNPIDIVGDADAKRFTDTLSILGKDKNIDALIISVTPTIKTNMDEIATVISDFSKKNRCLAISANLLSFEPEPLYVQQIENSNIPNFDFPEINVRVLSTVIKYYERIKQPKARSNKFKVNKKSVRDLLNRIQKEKRSHLSEPESYKILEAYGMKVIDYEVAKNLNEISIAADKIGYPVVLKIISSEILHKIDVGGVKINLKNNNEVKTAYSEITKNIKKKKPDAKIQGFLVQKYSTEKGFEIITGANAVKGFGSLIMFGSGGTFVELFKDVAFRLAPLTVQDALNIIKQTKGYQILKGYRGQPEYDIKAVVNYLLRVSQLVTEFPEIKELDLNPIKVLQDNKGIIIMDAKIVISD